MLGVVSVDGTKMSKGGGKGNERSEARSRGGNTDGVEVNSTNLNAQQEFPPFDPSLSVRVLRHVHEHNPQFPPAVLLEFKVDVSHNREKLHLLRSIDG